MGFGTWGTVLRSRVVVNRRRERRRWRRAILEIERIEANQLKLPWYKVRTEELSITLVPAFSDSVESARSGAAKAKYNLGVQGGFGLSTDNPAFYAGASYTIAKYFRVSAGGTTQRVTRLRDSQKVGPFLSAAEELSVTERFDPSR